MASSTHRPFGAGDPRPATGTLRLTRVLIADPQGLVVEALRSLLPDDHVVVGTALDGEALVRLALRLRPDLVLFEIDLPGLDGLEALRRIRDQVEGIRGVVLTSIEDAALAAEAFAAGAAGYLLKTETSSEFVTALRAIVRGRQVLSRRIAHGRIGRLPRRRQRPGGPRLSPRAGEVVRLVAEGLAMKEIAARLGITTRTVAFHKYRAMEVLGIGSSAGLVRFAIEKGLLRDRHVGVRAAVGLAAEA